MSQKRIKDTNKLFSVYFMLKFNVKVEVCIVRYITGNRS